MPNISKLQDYGNLIAIIFSDGSRVFAYPSSANLYYVNSNSNDIISLEVYGNQICINISGGVKVLAYPSTGGLWYVGPNADIGIDDWQWPLAQPPWSIVSGYGMRVSPIDGQLRMHWGVDISGGGINNTPILAASHGIVRNKGTNPGASYGYNLGIEHDDGSGTFYGHMIAASPLTVGQIVNLSTVVGRVGATGDATGPHLHFNTQSIFNNNANTNAVNPVDFMADRNAVMP